MKNQRLKQFAWSFLIVLSLFVSSVSACACSHESPPSEIAHCQPAPTVQTEDHHASRHSHDATNASHHEDKTPEKISVSLSENECCCIHSAPKVSAKTENVKIEKQKSAVSAFAQIESIAISPLVAVKTAGFVTPFYLSDSFHNLTPGRAPPRL